MLSEKLTAKYPGPVSSEMIEELQRYVIVTPQPFVVNLEASEGMWLATMDGQRLFDWAGYYASKLLGHNPPGLSEPDYLKRLALAANNKTANPDFLTPQCLEYYRLVHELAPECMRSATLEVYAVNSGAEAVENMLKYLINLYLQKHKVSQRELEKRRFIYFDQAFHGRTVFALNVTRLAHDPLITRDFAGFDHGNIRMTFPAVDTSRPAEENRKATLAALEALEAVLKREGDNIVGIILEPLQGAGGQRIAEPEFYRQLAVLAHRYGVLLGFDEVQTAGGQTGKFFAIDSFDLPYPPQAVACAKKMGCGVVYMLHPMTDKGVLDSTWGGHLADMVRFVQEMKIVRREALIEQVPAKAGRLVEHLSALQSRYAGLMSNVRGMGLYQGWTMASAESKSRLQKIALEQEDLLLLGAGTDAIRLRPMISVTLEEVDLFAQKLGRALETLETRGDEAEI